MNYIDYLLNVPNNSEKTSFLLIIVLGLLNIFQMYTSSKNENYILKLKSLEKEMVRIKDLLSEKEKIINIQNERIDTLEREIFQLTKENSLLKGLIESLNLNNKEKEKIVKKLKKI